MIDHRIDEEMILRDEVSDEALEAASVAPRELPTLMHNTYCFACPSRQSAPKLLTQRSFAEVCAMSALPPKADIG
jgi:hypothetical protein